MVPDASRASFPLAHTWCGVQLFFAISGFVILRTLDRTMRTVELARALWSLVSTLAARNGDDLRRDAPAQADAVVGDGRGH